MAWYIEDFTFFIIVYRLFIGFLYLKALERPSPITSHYIISSLIIIDSNPVGMTLES